MRVAGAEPFSSEGKGFARWTDKRDRRRTAPVVVPERGRHAGQLRIRVESRRFAAQHRDAEASLTIGTGGRDEGRRKACC